MDWDLKKEEDVKQYLDNLYTEYRFGCYSEKKPEGIYTYMNELLSQHWLNLLIEPVSHWSSVSLAGWFSGKCQKRLFESRYHIPLDLRWLQVQPQLSQICWILVSRQRMYWRSPDRSELLSERLLTWWRRLLSLCRTHENRRKWQNQSEKRLPRRNQFSQCILR